MAKRGSITRLRPEPSSPARDNGTAEGGATTSVPEALVNAGLAPIGEGAASRDLVVPFEVDEGLVRLAFRSRLACPMVGDQVQVSDTVRTTVVSSVA